MRLHPRRADAWGPSVLRAACVALVGWSAPALAEDGLAAPQDGAEAVAGAVADEDTLAELMHSFRGSRLAYRNTVSVLSFAPDAELTYNPYYAMSLRAFAQYWPHDSVAVWAEVWLAGEITAADWTTDDLYFVRDVQAGARAQTVVPVVDLLVGGTVSVSAPTTKESIARSKVLGLSLGGDASYTFEVLEGLTLLVAGSVFKELHQYTTAGPAREITGACALEPSPSCTGLLISSGERNVSWGLGGRLGVSLALTPWLIGAVDVGIEEHHLYPLPQPDPEGPSPSFQTAAPTHARHWAFASLAATVIPHPLFSVTVGARSVHPQLAFDGSYREPFFNRFTQIFVDLAVRSQFLLTWERT